LSIEALNEILKSVLDFLCGGDLGSYPIFCLNLGINFLTKKMANYNMGVLKHRPSIGGVRVHKQKRYFRFILISLVVISFIFCPLQSTLRNSTQPVSADEIDHQVTYEPQITPFVYHTLSPAEIGTAVYLLGPIEYEKDAFYSPTYKWVSCGGDPKYLNHTCYEICYGGNCYFVSDIDSRVSLYISLVDDREEKIDELGELDRDTVDVIFDVVTDCLEGAGAGVVIYSLFGIAVADPEPVSKTIVSVLSALATVAICGKSIWGVFSQSADKKVIVSDIVTSTVTAIDLFIDIEKYPVE
jgi:hypothetical protein